MAFNPVVSLSVGIGSAPTAGPSGNHIVVYDQVEVMIAPTDIMWVLDPSLAGVIATADGTGTFFTCPAGTPVESGNATATHIPTGVVGKLAINLMAPTVTSLQFSQE